MVIKSCAQSQGHENYIQMVGNTLGNM